jgi:hypothetical protein
MLRRARAPRMRKHARTRACTCSVRALTRTKPHTHIQVQFPNGEVLQAYFAAAAATHDVYAACDMQRAPCTVLARNMQYGSRSGQRSHGSLRVLL